MVLTIETKKDIIKRFGKDEKDTGSAEVQVALLTARIKDLTEKHLSVYKKDNHSRYGLLKLVNQRKGLLKYLKREHKQRYTKLIADLGLRDNA